MTETKLISAINQQILHLVHLLKSPIHLSYGGGGVTTVCFLNFDNLKPMFYALKRQLIFSLLQVCTPSRAALLTGR